MNKKLRIAILTSFESQADFAQTVKCDEALVSRVVRGRRKLSLEQAATWSKALGCDVAALVDTEKAA